MGHDMAHDALAMVEYGSNPAIILLADTEAGLARGRRSAELAGCRVTGAALISATDDGLDRQAAVASIYVELENPFDGLERLLDRLEDRARSGRSGSVVSAPFEMIDLIASFTPHRDIIQLAQANEADRVVAIARATAGVASGLHDIGKGDGPARLQQLSEEVGRIANILATLSEEDCGGTDKNEAPADGDASAVDAGYIRALIRARRLRDHYFQGSLFADPAWDMLLDLLAARLEDNRVAVSSLCIAAAVPATTALRWIKTLTDQGLFVRAADPQDGRRVYIELSDEAARQLTTCLAVARRLAPTVI